MLVCNVSARPRKIGRMAASEAVDIAKFDDRFHATLAASDLKDTAAFTANVFSLSGALAAIEAKDGAAFTGTVPVISGSLVATDIGDTAAFSGSIPTTGPGTWTPANYATAPFFWFDASDGATITIATGVSQWNDKSGHANHIAEATGANQPTRTTGVYNGLATLTFDGTNDRLHKSGSLTAATGSGTLFAVLKPTGASAGNVYWTTNGSVVCGVYVMSNSNGRYQCSSANHANYDPVDNTLVLQSGYITSAKREIFAGGLSKAANTTGTDTVNTPTQIWFGSDSNPITFFKGDLCEILLLAGTLSDADRQIFEGYLGWKWSASAALLDATHPYKTHGPDA